MVNKSIWQRKGEWDKHRRDYMHKVMKSYDENVYYPAVKELIKECEKSGHVKGNYHDNGLGWHWYYCSQCGVPFNKEQHTVFKFDEDDSND